MRSVIIATARGMRATDGRSLMGGRYEVVLLSLHQLQAASYRRNECEL